MEVRHSKSYFRFAARNQLNDVNIDFVFTTNRLTFDQNHKFEHENQKRVSLSLIDPTTMCEQNSDTANRSTDFMVIMTLIKYILGDQVSRKFSREIIESVLKFMFRSKVGWFSKKVLRNGTFF